MVDIIDTGALPLRHTEKDGFPIASFTVFHMADVVCYGAFGDSLPPFFIS